MPKYGAPSPSLVKRLFGTKPKDINLPLTPGRKVDPRLTLGLGSKLDIVRGALKTKRK